MSDPGDPLRVRMGAIRALVVARIRVFYREPGTMFWTFGLPFFFSIVLGAAFRNREPEPVHAAIEDGPRAAHVRDLLAKSPDIAVHVVAAEEGGQALRTGKVAIVVVADPADDAKAIYRFDPTRPDSRLARALVDDALQRSAGRVDAIAATNARVTEPGSRYIDFLIPGLLGMGMMSTGLWNIGFSLADMRTRRLLKRLVATPMHRGDLLASLLVVRVLQLVVELPPLLLLGYFAFGVGVNGSFVTLAIVALIGSLMFAGMGLLVASRSENPQIVSGLINVISLPMYVCSGIFFSPTRFPAWMQPFISAFPLTTLNDTLRAVMIDGATLVSIAKPVAILVTWGALSFAAALKLFRWR